MKEQRCIIVSAILACLAHCQTQTFVSYIRRVKKEPSFQDISKSRVDKTNKNKLSTESKVISKYTEECVHVTAMGFKGVEMENYWNSRIYWGHGLGKWKENISKV